jgi:dTMP kinase
LPSPASKGRLIVVEGPDGSGKTTLVRDLALVLAERGREVLSLREPGGTALSEQIRVLLKGVTLEGQINPRAETLLFCAARAQLVAETIRPALAAGKWVLLDRFEGSTVIYQGLGHELGIEAVQAVSAFATEGLRPDRILVLRVSAETVAARLAARGADPGDRLENLGEEFTSRVREGYGRLAELDAELVREIDAGGTEAEALARALAALEDLG